MKTVDGEINVDDRGCLISFNAFSFAPIKRFYQIENFDIHTIRAFHGHLKESKFIYAMQGSALLYLVKLDNVNSPSKKIKPKRFILSEKIPQLLYIPAGHANGFKMLQQNTKLIIFSTATLKESLADDFRYAYDYWGSDIWTEKNR